MKLSTKILALVFIVLAFWPVLVAIVLGHPYKASSEPPYVRGAMVWFFGVGGVGLLLQRSWKRSLIPCRLTKRKWLPFAVRDS